MPATSQIHSPPKGNDIKLGVRRSVTFNLRSGLSFLRNKVTDLVKTFRSRLRSVDAESTWLPLDLRERYNEEVYGYTYVYTHNVHFGNYRDSVERLAPVALRDEIFDRQYREQKQERRAKRQNTGLGIGCGGQGAF
jgi:hypothetical protein